jgi:GTP-binding protein YchF
MKIGLIGLSHSGKTTVFNAITGLEAPFTAYSGNRARPNVAGVAVHDTRLMTLSQAYHPKKITCALMEIADFTGLSAGSAREGLFSGEAMGMIRNMEAMALVVLNFENDFTGPPTPMKDMVQVEEELLVSDMIIAEGRMDRIQQGYMRGRKSDALHREEAILRRVLEQLNSGLPLRAIEFSPDEETAIRGFQFLTRKPLMVILNSDEASFGKNDTLMDEIGATHRVIEFAGNFEMELARLDEGEEKRLFMEEMGIGDSAAHRLTRLAYEILGYISFFTVGPDEVRAWNVHRGDTALNAAASIHTDLARGFIRAECFSYEDYIQHGSEKVIREQGRLRLEGKGYTVQDGDIMNIRFNVG